MNSIKNYINSEKPRPVMKLSPVIYTQIAFIQKEKICAYIFLTQTDQSSIKRVILLNFLEIFNSPCSRWYIRSIPTALDLKWWKYITFLSKSKIYLNSPLVFLKFKGIKLLHGGKGIRSGKPLFYEHRALELAPQSNGWQV